MIWRGFVLLGLVLSTPVLSVAGQAAQPQGTAQGTAQGGAVVAKTAASGPPSLATMAHAFLNQDYSVEQLRRFRDASGQITTVRERLVVDANGTDNPDFLIDFLAVEGEPPGSQLSQSWQQTYDRFGRLFFRHGSFHVRELHKAIANYSLHDFGQVVRAGRVARRFVVYPVSADKAIWIVDVDGLTSVPLYVAEFDNRLRVLSETEALTFTASAPAFATPPAAMTVTELPDFASAMAVLGNPTGVIEPCFAQAPDYTVGSYEVHADPINGRQKLVITYEDGIDQFMIVQSPSALDPFDGLPPTTGGTRAIGRFRDPAVSALVFWDDDVVFHVAGRGSLRRLDDVAKAVFKQALTH